MIGCFCGILVIMLGLEWKYNDYFATTSHCWFKAAFIMTWVYFFSFNFIAFARKDFFKKDETDLNWIIGLWFCSGVFVVLFALIEAGILNIPIEELYVSLLVALCTTIILIAHDACIVWDRIPVKAEKNGRTFSMSR